MKGHYQIMSATEGGEGVRQMLTMSDKMGRGDITNDERTDKDALKGQKYRLFQTHNKILVTLTNYCISCFVGHSGRGGKEYADKVRGQVLEILLKIHYIWFKKPQLHQVCHL